jgi:hypothetical protein
MPAAPAVLYTIVGDLEELGLEAWDLPFHFIEGCLQGVVRVPIFSRAA